MPSLKQIREAMAEALSVIDGVQVSAYMLAQPTPPTLWVVPSDVSYEQTMARGYDGWNLIVQGFVGAQGDRGAQERLDRLLVPSGPESVKAALEADKQLGGVVEDLHVREATGYRLYATDQTRPPWLGCEWTVYVIATGT